MSLGIVGLVSPVSSHSEMGKDSKEARAPEGLPSSLQVTPAPITAGSSLPGALLLWSSLLGLDFTVSSQGHGAGSPELHSLTWAGVKQLPATVIRETCLAL